MTRGRYNRLFTDVLREMVKEIIAEKGSQSAAERSLGLPRSTLSRFVRGQGLNSEAMDRLVEVVGLERLAAELQYEHDRRSSD